MYSDVSLGSLELWCQTSLWTVLSPCILVDGACLPVSSPALGLLLQQEMWPRDADHEQDSQNVKIGGTGWMGREVEEETRLWWAPGDNLSCRLRQGQHNPTATGQLLKIHTDKQSPLHRCCRISVILWPLLNCCCCCFCCCCFYCYCFCCFCCFCVCFCFCCFCCCCVSSCWWCWFLYCRQFGITECVCPGDRLQCLAVEKSRTSMDTISNGYVASANGWCLWQSEKLRLG